MGELIAVLSGKGGTGKTSLCAGIATALAQTDHKVLCIDCDIGLRNLDIALGISELGTISFLDVCRGDYSLDMATAHPEYPNLFFLTAPMNCPADTIDRMDFAHLLEDARLQFDYVFLDAPAGIEAGFALAANYADRILLVTGADPAAIRDAAQAGDLLSAMGKQNVRHGDRIGIGIRFPVPFFKKFSRNIWGITAGIQKQHCQAGIQTGLK